MIVKYLTTMLLVLATFNLTYGQIGMPKLKNAMKKVEKKVSPKKSSSSSSNTTVEDKAEEVTTKPTAALPPPIAQMEHSKPSLERELNKDYLNKRSIENYLQQFETKIKLTKEQYPGFITTPYENYLADAKSRYEAKQNNASAKTSTNRLNGHKEDVNEAIEGSDLYALEEALRSYKNYLDIMDKSDTDLDISEYKEHYAKAEQTWKDRRAKSKAAEGFRREFEYIVKDKKELMDFDYVDYKQTYSAKRYLAYENYAKNKKAYHENGKTDDKIERIIQEMELFYASEFEENFEKFALIGRCEFWQKQAEEYKPLNPDAALEKYEVILNLVNAYGTIPKDGNSPKFNALKAKYEKLKADVLEYRDGGAYAAVKAEDDRKELEEAFIPTKGKMHKTEFTNFIKEYKAPSKGTLLYYVVESDSWSVTKNDLDYPVERSLYIAALVKYDDGTCHNYYSTIVETHQGGGQYSGRFMRPWRYKSQVLCSKL